MKDAGAAVQSGVFRCWWGTRDGRPYLANLKVMRMVLRDLRDAVAADGGVLGAYVFVEDGIHFVTEGPVSEMPEVLARARIASERSFSETGGTGLWGDARLETLDKVPRSEALRPLAELPVERGLASRVFDYPWSGGPWLLERP